MHFEEESSAADHFQALKYVVEADAVKSSFVRVAVKEKDDD